MPVDSGGNHVVALAVGGTASSVANPLPIAPVLAGAAVSASNPLAHSAASSEIAMASALTLPTGASGQFWNSAAVVPIARPKSIYVLVTTAVVFASGQPTIRLYGSRTAVAAGNGAATALTLAQVYLSAALTITSAAQTTIPVNTLLRITSTFASYSVGAAAQCVLGAATGWGELDRWDSFIGVEFNWGGSFTSGALSVFLECGGV